MVRSAPSSFVVFASALAFAGVSEAFTTTARGLQPLHPSFVRPQSRGRLSSDASTTQLSALGMESAEALGSFLQTQPYLSAFLCCAAKASAADMVAQTSSQHNDNDDNDDGSLLPQVNIPRNLAFLAYGGLYQGMVQTFIFGTLFPAMFGTEPTVSTVMSQVAIDLLILGPMVCMPTVYTMKALFAGQEATDGISKYMNDVQNQGLWFKYWGLWAPVQTLNFAFVPADMRVYFVAFVSFFWICLLSTISSNTEAISQADQKAVQRAGLVRVSYPAPQEGQPAPVPVQSS